MNTRTVRGEFIEIDGQDIKPHDVLGEGRMVHSIHGGHHWTIMDVGPGRAVCEVVELASGPVCAWRIEWGALTEERVPQGTVRVFRGDPPGFFCTADAGTGHDPCTSDRCPIRQLEHFDGVEER